MQVQPLGLGVGEGLTDPRQGAGDHDLVGQLGVLAAAGGPLVVDVGPHGLENGQAGLVVGLLSPHQDGQGAVPGPGVSSGDRRVQHPEAPGRPLAVQPLGQGGAGGGHVDEVRSRQPPGSRMLPGWK